MLAYENFTPFEQLILLAKDLDEEELKQLNLIALGTSLSKELKKPTRNTKGAVSDE
jgi:hypothetical protein